MDHFSVYYVCYAAGITNGLPDFFNLLLIDFSTPPFLVPLLSLSCVVQYSTSIVEEVRMDNSKPFGHFIDCAGSHRMSGSYFWFRNGIIGY